MRKYEYCQMDYKKYPSEDDLDKMGTYGWELVCIEPFENRLFDDDIGYSYTTKIYKATFKRELINS